ncbi:MAG: type II secretion system F family protein [Isosphaeraceae bacterium]
MSDPSDVEGPSGPLSHQEVSRLSDQLAGLTGSQLPLAPGLRAAAAEMPRGRLRSALLKLARSLERGSTLDQAVDELGGRVPAHLRHVVRAGVRSGNVAEVLGAFAGFSSVDQDLRRKLWVNLAYPSVLLLLALGIFTFVCSVIVAAFEDIFKDFGVPLPGLTTALIVAARPFQIGRWTFIEIWVGLLGLMLVFKLVLSESTWRSMLGSIPVLGQVWRSSSLAEFCHLLAMLLECELPLPDSLALTGGGVEDASIEAACRELEADVRKGIPLSESVERQRVFPHGMGRLLRWGEGYRSLPSALHMAGEMFEARAKSLAGLVGKVVGLLALFAVFFTVAWVVVGLFLPLLMLISRLNG